MAPPAPRRAALLLRLMPSALLLLLLPPPETSALPAARRPPRPQGLGGSLKQSPWKEQDEKGSSIITAIETVKGFSRTPNDQATQWNPPRCGVPDLPTPPGSRNTRNRQKRFLLSGGRWEKTEFTYK